MEKEISFNWYLGETPFVEVFDAENFNEDELSTIDYLCDINSVNLLYQSRKNYSEFLSNYNKLIYRNSLLNKVVFCFKETFTNLYVILNRDNNWFDRFRKFRDIIHAPDFSLDSNRLFIERLYNDYLSAEMFFQQNNQNIAKLETINSEITQDLALIEKINVLLNLDVNENEGVITQKVNSVKSQLEKIQKETELDSLDVQIKNAEQKINALKDIIQSCKKSDKYKGNRGCYAILETDKSTYYALSGLDYDGKGVYKQSLDTSKTSSIKDIAAAIKNKYSNFIYAPLNDKVLRYTSFINKDTDNIQYITTPKELSSDYGKKYPIGCFGLTYGCCERKMLSMAQSANEYTFYIKRPPCEKCMPSMINLSNCIIWAYKPQNQRSTALTPKMTSYHVYQKGDFLVLQENQLYEYKPITEP